MDPAPPHPRHHPHRVGVMSTPAPKISLEGITPTKPRAERPGKTPHTSFSQLTMYLRCSMQYYFRYVLGLKQRPRLFFANGTAGHKALETNALHKIAHGEDQALDAMLATFSDTYDKEVAELEKRDLKPGDDIGKTKDGTVNVLTYYRNVEAPLVTPRAVEMEFLVPLPATETYQTETPPVNGFIDQVSVRRPEPWRKLGRRLRTSVDDHKFPARRMPQAKIDLSTQHDMYDLVLTRAGVPTDDLTLQVFLPPNKKEGPRVERMYRDAALMTPEARAARHERLLYKLRTVARGIKEGIFVPTDDPQTCAGCGYRDMCQFSLVKKDYEELQLRASRVDRPNRA